MTNPTIVPAQPGFFVIYSDGPELILGEPVIAWAISVQLPKVGEFHAQTYPIGPDGEPAGNWVGIQNPDGKVSVLAEDYRTFDDAQAAHTARSQSGSQS